MKKLLYYINRYYYIILKINRMLNNLLVENTNELCLNNYIKQFLNHVEIKYKDKDTKVYFIENGLLRTVNDKYEEHPFLEIHNKFSNLEGGNSINVIITEIRIKKSNVSYILNILPINNKEIDLSFIMTFELGNSGIAFGETPQNKEFYDFIENADSRTL